MGQVGEQGVCVICAWLGAGETFDTQSNGGPSAKSAMRAVGLGCELLYRLI